MSFTFRSRRPTDGTRAIGSFAHPSARGARGEQYRQTLVLVVVVVIFVVEFVLPSKAARIVVPVEGTFVGF
ncbi:MAG: hypothetical protein ABJN26_19845 [Stappiaceae bacterium]